MRPNFGTSKAIILMLLLVYLFPANIFSQDNSAVVEPSIPIYIVCPYHEDSLKAAFSGSFAGNGSSLTYAINKCDTLQQQIAKLSAEDTIHFTWFYALIALIGTMNIVLLFSTTRIRKELSQIKRLEHQQKLATTSTDVELQATPIIQEPLSNQHTNEPRSPVRIKRPRKKNNR